MTDRNLAYLTTPFDLVSFAMAVLVWLVIAAGIYWLIKNWRRDAIYYIIAALSAIAISVALWIGRFIMRGVQ